jgi:hypothetical protein
LASGSTLEVTFSLSEALSSPGTRRAAWSRTLEVSSSRWIVWSSRVIESTLTES